MIQNAGVEPGVLTQKQLRRNRFSHIAQTTKRYKTIGVEKIAKAQVKIYNPEK
jgi:hypothetical protein